MNASGARARMCWPFIQFSFARSNTGPPAATRSRSNSAIISSLLNSSRSSGIE